MKKIEFKELYIYGISSGKDGHHTNKFCNGQLFEDSFISKLLFIKSDYYIFTYTSETTKEVRKAKFLKKNISGIAYTEK